MYIDWFFSIGKAHTICEDYAINGDNNVIVSDGCSSAKHTDLGARLIAHSARILLNDDLQYNELGNAVINQALNLLNVLKMGCGCLYATLLIARILPSGEINVKMYGDGVIVVISEDNTEIIEVSFTNNMPYYLVYRIDSKSMEEYKKFKNELIITQTINGKLVNTLTTAFDAPIEYTFDPAQIRTVLIATDGLSSFENAKTRQSVPLSTISDEITAFKVMRGAFLKRRLIRALEDMAVNKIFPLDDVGIAGISLEEGERQCLTTI